MVMSAKKGSRIVLTLEVKKYILQQREKNITFAKIGDAVYKEYQIRTSKSAIHRTFAKKKEILAKMENGKPDWNQRKR